MIYKEYFIECPAGYYGDNCSFPCPALSYGSGCAEQCSCSSESCHHVYGCNINTGWWKYTYFAFCHFVCILFSFYIKLY